MRKVFPITICLVVLSSVAPARRQAEPLANENKSGLYARSIEQVLRLREDEVDLATAALIVSEHWSDMVYGRRYLSRLDDMALEIRDRLRRGGRRVNSRAIPVINDYLFNELRFKSIAEANDPNSLFLHTVMDEKRGYCLSLSVLYLAIAERIGLPLYGVVVPGHFFVRYDDGRMRFNIETTSNGGTASDEHYINKFNVPPGGNDSIYMKNLNKIQTLGCFFNNLGNSYSDVGNMDAALMAFEQAVEINPTLSESRANLGNIYLKKDLVREAIDEYLTALQINPNDAKTHNNLGNAYTQRDSLVLAIDEYQRAIALDPSFADAHKNLAIVYSREKRYGRAIAQLNRALDLDSNDAGCYNQFGDVYSQMNDYEQAISRYKKALRIKQDFVDPHYGLALCYNKLGLVSDEIWEYQQILAIKPDMLAALVNLGNAYFSLNKYSRAIEYYNKAVRIKPDEAMVHYNLGAAYSKSSKHTEAITAYLKAVQIDPEIGDAHYGLAFGFYHAKKYDLAWTHIKIAQKLGVEVTEDQLKAIESRLR
ncbi:MAG: tetratricopeptide repeat protein [Phycisphaerae bacterium]|nr:tetratricopeptide repeat protein [Phycisphaerae bacterium]